MTLNKFLSSSYKDKNNVPYGISLYYDQHMLMYYLMQDMIENNMVNLSINPTKAKQGKCVFYTESDESVEHLDDYAGAFDIYSKHYKVKINHTKNGDTITVEQEKL